MDFLIAILEKILFVCIFVFPISTIALIRTVKRKNMELVKNAISNPILPDLDLNFFAKVQNEYIRITGKHTLTSVNKISFYLSIFAFILMFFCVVINEMFRY
jgi:hypothetical protein